MSDRLITADIRKALLSRFAAPEWAAFFEVAQGTGSNGGRSADCVAMNLFPSRGLRVHGVEIKASRSDWQRELRDPSKAEPIMRFCDHWWIAAKPSVVLDGELPPTWGLLELHGGVLRQRIAAPKLDAEPMGRPFIAAMFRRAAEKAGRELQAACDRKLEIERAQISDEIARRVKERSYKYDGLRKAVDDFERASGIRIEEFGDAQGLGAAVKLLHQTGVTSTYSAVRNAAKMARQFAESVEQLLPTSATGEAA